MDLLNTKKLVKTQQSYQKRKGRTRLKLKSNKDRVIKKADKGSAVVVMNTTDYLRSILPRSARQNLQSLNLNEKSQSDHKKKEF